MSYGRVSSRVPKHPTLKETLSLLAPTLDVDRAREDLSELEVESEVRAIARKVWRENGENHDHEEE